MKSDHTNEGTQKTLIIHFRDLWHQRHYLLPLSVILAFTALLYFHALQNDILSWDDHWHITYNADIKSLSFENIKAMFTSYYSNMYHPLTTLSFAVEYGLVGLNPTVYHATNVFLHLVNVMLVFFLVLRLSQRREIAVIAACLFGIHPMHVESVAWITERKDVLYTLFYLYGLVCYVRFREKEGKKWYGMAFLSFLLSLCSKTTALTFPLVLLFIDGYYALKIKKRMILEKLPFVLLSIIFGIVALSSQSETTNFEIFKQFNVADRIFLASYSLCFYFFHLFVPMNLSALHSLPEKIQGLLPLEYYLAVLPVIAMILLGTRKGVLQREYRFGMLFFLCTLFLNIHIIPFGKAIVAERYSYVPFIGIYYLIGQLYCFIIDRYPNLLQWKKIFFSMAVCTVMVYGYFTYQRIGVWKNTLLLFHDASMKANTTKDAVLIQALGYVLEAEEKTNARKYPEAVELYNQAIGLDSQRVESYSNRGIAKHCLQDYEGAMKDYTKAIELNPSFSRAYANRAAIYLLWNKQDEACKDFHAAYSLGLHSVLPALQAYCQ